MPADRWLERALATACPEEHGLPGGPCWGGNDSGEHPYFCASRIQAAEDAGGFTRATVAAWLLDRVAQYDNESGYHAFVAKLVRGIRTGEVEAAAKHGELDDILARLRPGRTTPEPR